MSIDSCSKYFLVSIRLASCLSRNRVLRGSTGCGLLLVWLLVLSVVPAATSQATPYSVKDVEKLAMDGISEHNFLELVKQHDISFAPTVEVMEELRIGHVPGSVLKEIWTHIPQGQPPEFYLKEGDHLLRNGYYAEAIAYYQRLLLQIPNDLSAKARIEQANEQQQKAEAAAKEQEQKAEAAAKLRTAQDTERPNLSYYRQQLSASLQKPDCDGAFYYAHKIFFVGPDQSEKSAYEKVCGPYTVTLKEDTPVTLAFQRDLKGADAQSGDKVDFKVVDPIVMNGLLIVPKDGVAWGTVAKAEGGRRLSRVGQLRINIEGMWLANGEKCSLEDEENYRGAKKSKKAKAGYAVGSVLLPGVPLIFLGKGRGNDVTIRAGTKVAANVTGTMKLEPAQFEPSGPAPKGPPIELPQIGLNVVSFQNLSGTDATVRLLGPSAQVLTVVGGQSVSARVAAGDYYILVRYGKNPEDYLFEKDGPIPVTEPSGHYSVAGITLKRPAADNPKAREEFYKGQ